MKRKESEAGRKQSGEVKGCEEEEEEEGGLEDHSKSREERMQNEGGSERGKQKERRKREGEHVVKEERGVGWRRGLASEGPEKWKKGEEEREKSTWTDKVWRFPFTCQVIRWWCVFTPRRCRNQMRPTPFKSLLPTISSCSHVG